MTAGDALRLLHAAGWIARPWLPGLRAQVRGIWYRRSDDGTGWLFPSAISTEGHANRVIDQQCEPDLTDPATVGCLLALLRVASMDPTAATQAVAFVHDQGPPAWVAVWWAEGWVHGDSAPTEGGAIAAGLVALAGAL